MHGCECMYSVCVFVCVYVFLCACEMYVCLQELMFGRVFVYMSVCVCVRASAHARAFVLICVRASRFARVCARQLSLTSIEEQWARMGGTKINNAIRVE